MFDIGSMELLLVAVVALVVVGPKDLPRLLRTVAGVVKKARDMAAEFRLGVHALAQEVEREFDPFTDLRREEGLQAGMTPEQITAKIMADREAEAKAARDKATQDRAASGDAASEPAASSVKEAAGTEGSKGATGATGATAANEAHEPSTPGDDNVR